MYTELFEHGLVPIPIQPKSKAPVSDARGFNVWARDGIPPEMVELFEQKYPTDKYGIAIVLGPASNLCVVDIDSDDEELLRICPPSPVRRRGKKGEARFFKYNPNVKNISFKNGTKGVDVLCDKKYIIIPPSIHPDTGLQYRWTSYDDLCGGLELLEPLHEQSIEPVAGFFHSPLNSSESSSVELTGTFQSPDGVRAPHGSYLRIKALAHGFINECMPIEQAVQKLIDYDKEHHLGVRFFEDKRTHADFGADPYSNALRIYSNFMKSVNEERLRRGESPQIPSQRIEIVDVSDLTKAENAYLFKSYPEPRGFMKTFVDHCDTLSKGRQDALGLGGALALMAGLCSNRVQTKVRGLSVWPNLFVLNIGYSSFGKSAPQRLIDDLLLETDLVGSANYRSGSAIVQNLPKQQERVDVIDEASALLKALGGREYFQNEMVEVLSDLFSKSSGFFTGFSSITHGQHHGACWNPCVNVLASTTPVGFKTSVTKDMAGKGLLPRFLTFFQKEIGTFKAEVDEERLASLRLDLEKFVSKILGTKKPLHNEFNPTPNLVAKHKDKEGKDISQGVRYSPLIVPFDDGARKLWTDFDRMNFNKAKQDPDGFESAFYGRHAELVAKVSLLDAVSRKDDIIRAECVQWSIDLVTTAWDNCRPLYALTSAENSLEASHMKVLELIRQHTEPMTRSKLATRTQWLNRKLRNDIVESLIEGEYIDEVEVKTDGSKKPTRYLRARATK